MLFKISFLMLFCYTEAMKINKCCPENQQYIANGNNLICVPFNESIPNYWLPDNFNETNFENFTVNFNAVPCRRVEAELSIDFELIKVGDSIALEDQGIYEENSFCLERLHQFENVDIKLAYECPCINQICLYKCCPNGQHLKRNKITHKTICIESENVTDWNFDLLDGAEIEKHLTMYGSHQCAKLGKTGKYLVEFFQLRKDGSIHSEIDGIIPANEYCGEFMQDDDENLRESKVIACVSDSKVKLVSKIYAGFCLIGVFFLIITVILHFWLPEIGGSPKWSLAIQAACLLVAYLCLVYQQLSPSLFGRFFCIFCAFLMQFSFLASFFWLNVMCIDISCTFSGIKAPVHDHKNERRKFIWYSIYAWGGSTLITLAAVIAEFASILPRRSHFKPNIAIIKCWFKDKESLWVFFYGPIGLILLSNLIFFTYTIFKIMLLRRGTEALRQDENSRNTKKNQQRLYLYLKIFVVMGVSWLTEIISWILDDDGGLYYIWFVTDAINLLRAVYIFKFFCWKRKVWVTIKRKVPRAVSLEVFYLKMCCKAKGGDDFPEKKTSVTYTSSGKNELSYSKSIHLEA